MIAILISGLILCLYGYFMMQRKQLRGSWPHLVYVHQRELFAKAIGIVCLFCGVILTLFSLMVLLLELSFSIIVAVGLLLVLYACYQLRRIYMVIVGLGHK